MYGAPIRVARDASETEMERVRLLLESELGRLTAEADRLAAGRVGG